MVHIISSKRSNLAEKDYVQRMASIAHLVHASKDINLWSRSQQGRPDWAAKSCHHVLVFRDRKTGIEQPFLIDRTQADEHGDFEPEHKRITEHFTQSLLELDHMIKDYQARANLGKAGLLLPPAEVNFAIAARDALHRGDHPNNFS